MFVSCLSLGKVQKVALLDLSLPGILQVKDKISLSRHVTGTDKDFKLLSS